MRDTLPATGVRTSVGGPPQVPVADPSRAESQGVDDIGELDALPKRERLVRVMEKAGWVQAKAARMLGMTPRQVGYALRKHRIDIKRFLGAASAARDLIADSACPVSDTDVARPTVRDIPGRSLRY